jgi:hypothetical protein
MPTQLLSIGPPQVLLQNVVYALPAVACVLFIDGAAPTLQLSSTLAFTANIPVVLVDGSARVAAGFIRATTAGATITLKRA